LFFIPNYQNLKKAIVLIDHHVQGRLNSIIALRAKLCTRVPT